MIDDRFTDDARDVYNLALREALSLGYNYIRPEHLLLALLRQEDSVTAWALSDLGIEPSVLRKAVLGILLVDLRHGR